MSVGAPRRAWITPQGETHKVTIDDHDHYDWVANNLDKIDPSLHSEYGDHADTMTAMLHAGWIRKANSDSYTVGEGHEHRVRAYHLRTHPEEREIYIDVRHRNKKRSSFKYNLDTRTKVKLGESADSLIKAVLDENTIAKGECFSWAFKRVLDHHVKGEDDAVLVHASVKHPWTGKRYEHAWVEHKGKVYDWQSTAMGLGKQHTVASFKAGYEPKQIKRYNGKQAVRASARAKHYGPW